MITNLDRLAPDDRGDGPTAEVFSAKLLAEDADDATFAEAELVIEELSLERPERLRSGMLTGRYELAAFTEAVNTLRSEPTLVLLSTLMSQASQAAKTAHFQASSLARDLEVLRSGPDGSADAIIGKILNLLDNPKSARLRWEPHTTENPNRFWLVDEFHKQILDAEILEDGLAVGWNTYSALHEFCNASKRVLTQATAPSPIGLLVKLHREVGVRTDEIADMSELQTALRKLTEDEKFSLLRLDTDDARLWFIPGDLFTTVASADAVLQPSRISIHVYRRELLPWFSKFASWTSSQIIDSAVATRFLEELWVPDSKANLRSQNAADA